jgi:RHS repeat-associated protein
LAQRDETVTNSLTIAIEAYTAYEYDNYVNEGVSGNHAPIQTNSGMIQYDGSWFSPQFAAQSQPRGNATSVKRLISGAIVGGSYATEYSQYDEAGNMVKAIDPLGHATTISYADNFGDGSNPDVGAIGTNGATFAFATSATNALLQVVKTQYDYTGGVGTGVKDLNGTIAKTEYNDPYDRPTRVTAAYGLPEAAKTEMSYPTATANETRVSKQLDSIRWLAYKTTYDGFGRPLTANEAEDGNHASMASFTIFSKLIYDGMGRVKLATNPYRSTAASTDGWTRTAYDLAGRVIQVATFAADPNTQPPDYPATSGAGVTWTGSVTTSYASEITTVTDQAGKQRRSVVDGLGRLVRVDEPDSSGNLDNNANPPQPVQPTSYSYDARGNLKTVTQGAQSRAFSYDLLSRLMSASNPESGTVNYTYYDNGNLKTRTDARSPAVVTTYFYDVLNRVTRRTYSDSTPEVDYYYDGQPLPSSAPSFTRGSSTGRLVAVCYGGTTASAGSYTGYDSLGRANVSVQQTDGLNYAFSYGYNLAGQMISETYPSGRVVQTEYDAAGRLAGVKNPSSGLYYAGAAASDAVNRIQYAAQGAVSAMKLGNTKWEHTTFNSRLQPLQIGLGTSSSDSSLLKLDYTYNTTGQSDNNGNVLTQKFTIGTTVFNQSYAYDALNRLQSASENNGASWSQTYGYDRFGNRRVSASPGYTLSTLTPQTQSAFNAANNRVALSAYDGAGNQTGDVQNRAFTYDAENRQITFNGTSGQYFYDGDGRRVKKIDNTGTTVFVYNVAGQLIAEYTSGTPSGSGTSYLTSDHLGSTRVVTKSDGSVKARYDYLPFGEEIPSTVGGRSSVGGYGGADGTRQRFTQKERDNESGLDYFGSRYYSSPQARFTSADQPLKDQHVEMPQSWNLYVYVRGNPLRYYDDDGREVKSIELKVSGANQGNKRTSQEVRNVDQLGAKATSNFIGFAVNVVVTVTDDDSPQNYKPVQRAFVISPDVDNQDPNRPGKSRVEQPDNPEKDNVTAKGKQLIWSDNPGVQVSGAPIGGSSGTIYSLFVSTVKPKDEKKGEGKPTDKVMYWGVRG